MTWKLIIKGISPDIPRKDGSTYVAYVLYATDWYLVPPSFWDGTKYLTQHMVQNIILAFFHILHIIIMFYMDLHGTMWGPPVISWFINPMNYSYVRIINHSYWSCVRQLSYLGGLTLYILIHTGLWFGCHQFYFPINFISPWIYMVPIPGTSISFWWNVAPLIAATKQRGTSVAPGSMVL